MVSISAAGGSSVRASRRTGWVFLLAVAVVCVGPCLSPRGVASHPGLAAAGVAVEEEPSKGFAAKVVGAAAQGATAALVAAALSACTEPLVNRLLVKRMTFAQAWKELSFRDNAKFFLTTSSTNMLKFPVFEVINIIMSLTDLSGSVRGIVSGWLFCTLMLPVTNFRYRKSVGLPIEVPLLYQAYIPTVCRDMVYGWARGFLSKGLSGMLGDGAVAQATMFGVVIFFACIISSPCNEWRGFTLQSGKKLTFKEFFKPINYARSTFVGACIMGVALAVGLLVNPYAETFFGWLKGHPAYSLVAVAIIAIAIIRRCK